MDDQLDENEISQFKQLMAQDKAKKEDSDSADIDAMLKAMTKQKQGTDWTGIALGAIPLLTSAMMGSGGAEAADVSSGYYLDKEKQDKKDADLINTYKLKAALEKYKAKNKANAAGSDGAVPMETTDGFVGFGTKGQYAGRAIDTRTGLPIVDKTFQPIAKRGPGDTKQLVSNFNYQADPNSAPKELKAWADPMDNSLTPLPNQAGVPVMVDAVDVNNNKIKIPLEQYEQFKQEQKIPEQLINVNQTQARELKNKFDSERANFLKDPVVTDANKDVFEYNKAMELGALGNPTGEMAMARFIAKKMNSGTLTDKDVNDTMVRPSFGGSIKQWLQKNFGEISKADQYNAKETSIGSDARRDLMEVAKIASAYSNKELLRRNKNYSLSALRSAGVEENPANVDYIMKNMDPNSYELYKAYGSRVLGTAVKSVAPKRNIPSAGNIASRRSDSGPAKQAPVTSQSIAQKRAILIAKQAALARSMK